MTVAFFRFRFSGLPGIGLIFLTMGRLPRKLLPRSHLPDNRALRERISPPVFDQKTGRSPFAPSHL